MENNVYLTSQLSAPCTSQQFNKNNLKILKIDKPIQKKYSHQLKKSLPLLVHQNSFAGFELPHEPSQQMSVTNLSVINSSNVSHSAININIQNNQNYLSTEELKVTKNKNKEWKPKQFSDVLAVRLVSAYILI